MCKKLMFVFISLLFFMTSVCYANKLNGNRWEYVTNTTNNEQVYCDVSSLRQNNNYTLEAWICYYKANSKPKKETYRYCNYTINGNDRVYYTNSYYVEDGTGKQKSSNPLILAEISRELGWRHYAPNSIVEVVFNRYYRNR